MKTLLVLAVAAALPLLNAQTPTVGSDANQAARAKKGHKKGNKKGTRKTGPGAAAAIRPATPAR